MKKIVLVILTITIVMVLTGALYIASSSAEQDEQQKKNVAQKNTEKKSCCAPGIESGRANENSVYLLEGNWKTESNKEITWSSLEGTTRIMAMIFTNCTYACPVIVNDMKNIEAGLSKDELKKVKFLLVSIDPERDSPETLKKFAAIRNLDLNRWQLITSNKNNISELAAVLGFRYKKENDGSFSHSNIITVLNAEGEVAYQHFGLNKNIEDVINAVKN